MKRIVSFVSIFVLSAICTFGILWKQMFDVTIQVDDHTTTLKTNAKTVGELLKREGIAISEHDLVWPDQGTKLADNLNILVQKARPITVQIGSKPEIEIETTARTVFDVLKQLGYQYREDDIITPELDSVVTMNDKIKVIQVTYGLIREREEIKYSTVRKADNTLPKGQETVVTKGDPGERIVTYRAKYHNGELVEAVPIKIESIDQPTNEVVTYGTLEQVSIDGYTFLPKKILKNVILTAYGPGAEHTGKGPEDPEYGITRSGVRAKEGRTIAVDPDIIPLGWWVYIEGYGLYHAEDTGSAVRGKKIDIFYENDEIANDFGLKRGFTVYVIGPKKPERNVVAGN